MFLVQGEKKCKIVKPMISVKRIVDENRKYFLTEKESFINQKSMDLSVTNLRMTEIIDLIIWSSKQRGKTKNDTKKR